MAFHYTYRITNIMVNKHYYGVRTSNNIPTEDIGIYYFSSSSDKGFIQDQKENPQNYKYKVVAIFSTRKKAINYEIKLHEKFDVGSSSNFYNKSNQTSSGFDNKGGYLWNEAAKSKVKGITTYKDKEGNTFRVTKKDKRVISGELVSYNKGVSYKDNDKLIAVRSEAIKGNKNPSAAKINIYTNEDVLVYSCFGNFHEICKENNLPVSALKTSYLKKTKLYENSPQCTISKLKGLGLYEYKDWYAIRL